MFHWLSNNIVRFKVEVGVGEKLQKITLNTRNMAIPAERHIRPAGDDAIIMTNINTQHSTSKYTITVCWAKVKFKVSVWM